jgi:hypothetical protein
MRPLTLAIAIFMVACNDTTNADDTAADDLARQQARWRNQNPHSYTFDYQRTAFLAPVATQPVRITVRADTVAAVVNRETGAVVPLSLGITWPTVDSLFADAARVAAGDPTSATTSVRYDPQWGFPIELVVAARVPDVSWSERAGNLQAIH